MQKWLQFIFISLLASCPLVGLNEALGFKIELVVFVEVNRKQFTEL